MTIEKANETIAYLAAKLADTEKMLESEKQTASLWYDECKKLKEKMEVKNDGEREGFGF